MNENYTDITVVLDRSGSMQSIHQDMMGGYNRFLLDQQALGEKATFSLAQFDNQYDLVYDAIPLAEVPELTNKTFVPRGSTALLDALGRTIDATGRRLAKLQDFDRPGKVIFVIITDGRENASREFSPADIKQRITHQQEKYSWQFVFLGANQDAIATAGNLGIARKQAMTYANNTEGAERMFDSLSANMVRARKAPKASLSFTEEDRNAQRKAGAK